MRFEWHTVLVYPKRMSNGATAIMQVIILKGGNMLTLGIRKNLKWIPLIQVSLFIFKELDGTGYELPRERSGFYIQPEEENFQVIQRFGDGKVLYHTGNQSSLQQVTFYNYRFKYFDGWKVRGDPGNGTNTR